MPNTFTEVLPHDTGIADPHFEDERVRLAAAAFRAAEGRSAAAAAGTGEPAMVEFFLITSGYLKYGDPGSSGERSAA